jgi:hypothetical protein
MNYLIKFYQYILDFLKTKLGKISAETLGWMANLTLHAATIPTFIALMTGVSNKLPPVDLILMIWAALGLIFFKAVLLKDRLNIVTISVGFIVQATFLVLIFFK